MPLRSPGRLEESRRLAQLSQHLSRYLWRKATGSGREAQEGGNRGWEGGRRATITERGESLARALSSPIEPLYLLSTPTVRPNLRGAPAVLRSRLCSQEEAVFPSAPMMGMQAKNSTAKAGRQWMSESEPPVRLKG